MDKSSRSSIEQHIIKTARLGGSGYYCVLHQDNTVFDIFHIIVDANSIDIMLIGTDLPSTPKLLASNIEDEAEVVDFKHLNDVLLAQHRDRPDNF